MDPRRLERDIARGSVDAAFRVASMDEAAPLSLLAKAKRMLQDVYHEEVAEAASLIGNDGTVEDFRNAADAIADSRFVVDVPWLVMFDLATVDDEDRTLLVGPALRRSDAARRLEQVARPDLPPDRRSRAAFSIMLRDVMDSAADDRMGSDWIGSCLAEARRPRNTAFVYSYRDRSGWAEREERTLGGRISGGELHALRLAGKQFIPEQVGLPPLQGRGGGRVDPERDHPWHEFERAYLVDDDFDDERDVGDFVLEFCAREWDREAAMDRIMRSAERDGRDD